MSTVVLVVGDGLLADFVCGELSAECDIVRQTDWTTGVADTANLALVLHDGWDPPIHYKAEQVFQQAGIPWLRGFTSFGEGVVGPLVRPDIPGCSQCADMRRLMALHDRKEMSELQERLAMYEGVPRDAWASRTALRQVAHVVVAEAQRVLKGCRAHSEGRVLLINLKTLKSSRHFFLPEPLCPICGRLPEDSATTAQLSLQPSPKVSSDSYRCRSMEELKEVLVKDYLDLRTGFLNRKMHDLQSPFTAVSVNLPLPEVDEATGGRSHSYVESELTAILEGLERYCGTEPLGKRTIIRESFLNLVEHSLNPVQVGVHAKEQYAHRDFPFKPFDPNRHINWVWGYSFLQERPLLLPESVVYYGIRCDRFVYDTSNGCALGGSLVEAIVYGILEVVERDSFLMTWYARLPVPRLNPDSAHDHELRLMVDRLRLVMGYDVYIFNTTTENGVPSVWAVAKNRNQNGVNLICSAGAHLDPVRAAKSAIHTLAGMIPGFETELEANREKYERMYHDPFLVQEMEDHAMVYCLPQAEQRLDFLLDSSRPLRTFDEEFKPRVRHEDLTDDLNDLLQLFRRLHLDVIVVDQTTPELQRNRLHCVRVFIPGMLPMTFGHRMTRLEGLERVLRVPVDLGYAAQPLTLKQLNPHPHPFP